MSARDDIADLLEKWLQLTHAETRAIQAREWISLTQIQTAKVRLQQPVTDALGQWARETAQGNTTNHPFRAEVNRLISLESRNGELLATPLRRAQTERICQDNAVRNLRRLQKSYGSKPDNGWESYS